MDLKAYLKKLEENQSPWKKVIGVVCFILGFLALITPLTPGSWLIFVGLELLGVRLAIWDRIKNRFIK